MQQPVNRRRASPRLINIAGALTVAALIAGYAASLVPVPHSVYAVADAGRWEFATGLWYLLSLAALAAWALWGASAVWRWSAGFEGY